MNSGWAGKILRISLTDETIKTEPLNLQDAKLYVGGRGLGTKYYMDEVSPETDPLSPANKLILMTGPLTGTLAACAGMYAAVTKMPFTGTLGAFNLGGYFGPELKFAGYDGIILEGKAQTPVYLYIHNDRIEFRDAGHFWGRNVSATIHELNQETDEGAKMVCVGPSVEELVLLGSAMNHKTGTADGAEFGAVMGVKNLKAIVVKGTKSIRVAKNKEYLDACLKTRSILKENPVTGVGKSAGKAQISANALKKGCFGCSLGCGKITENSHSHSLDFSEGPEFSADWSLGPECGNSIPKVMDSLAIVDTAAMQKTLRELTAVVDSLGICRFTISAIGLPEISELFRACTGIDYKEEEILQIGERICNLEKTFGRKKV